MDRIVEIYRADGDSQSKIHAPKLTCTLTSLTTRTPYWTRLLAPVAPCGKKRRETRARPLRRRRALCLVAHSCRSCVHTCVRARAHPPVSHLEPCVHAANTRKNTMLIALCAYASLKYSYASAVDSSRRSHRRKNLVKIRTRFLLKPDFNILMTRTCLLYVQKLSGFLNIR